MTRRTTREIDAASDRLWAESAPMHPWYEPGVTATEPVALDTPIDHDGTNRAYAMMLTDEDPTPVAITVDETHIAIVSADGFNIVLPLDAISASVRSWSQIRIETTADDSDGDRHQITFEFLEKRLKSNNRAKKVAAAAILVAGAAGPAGAVGMGAGALVLLTLSWARMPMLYRHLELHAESFAPMSWHHPKRILYSTIGSAGAVFFAIIALLVPLIGGAIALLFMALLVVPLLRDGVSIVEVPVIALATSFVVAFSAIVQNTFLTGGAIEAPYFCRALSGRANPAERADILSFSLGNKRTDSSLLTEMLTMAPPPILWPALMLAVVGSSLDISREGEIGIAQGNWAFAYYGAIAIVVVTTAWYAVRKLIVSTSTLHNNLLRIHHRSRANSLLDWANARRLIITAIVMTIVMIAVPPLFAP